MSQEEENSLALALRNYTNPSSGSYDPNFDRVIRNLRPDWFIKSSDLKKDQILEEAKNGEPRPHYRNHPLGKAFSNYISPSSRSYDPEFDAEIHELRPDWFVTQSEKAQERKNQILDMAKNGESRPHQRNHPLGQAFRAYTGPSSDSYDPEFDAEIRELRPDWFVTQSEKAQERKNQILDLARNGEARPNSRNHPLGQAFSDYIKSSGGSYDPEFDAEIRELRPDWFINPSDIVQEKKNQILDMAQNGEPRPHYRNHPLGPVFNNYITSSSNTYDPEFDAEIRELRPDWFINPSDIAQKKKDQILNMAKNGESRPHQRNHPLGQAFKAYINPSNGSYDPEFDAEIRRLRPDWFISRSDIAQEKKDQILDMARNGEPRPHSKNHPLGNAFNDYIKSSGSSYDPEFDAEIRRLRPDWFKRSKRKSNDR